ncbi:hypothetical protein [Streptomyces avicenniae]|uniref:hypothetical protein n=1 Tax=Streptomyces avicenniae TaxID=500153 RepID=UPI000A7AC68E|nr:hypothetical protein [Streptomyces avicenniae]
MITYRDVSPGADIQRIGGNDSVEETLVLYSPDVATQWRFPVPTISVRSAGDR